MPFAADEGVGKTRCEKVATDKHAVVSSPYAGRKNGTAKTWYDSKNSYTFSFATYMNHEPPSLFYHKKKDRQPSHLDRGVGAEEGLERFSRGHRGEVGLGNKAVVEEDRDVFARQEQVLGVVRSLR